MLTILETEAFSKAVNPKTSSSAGNVAVSNVNMGTALDAVKLAAGVGKSTAPLRSEASHGTRPLQPPQQQSSSGKSGFAVSEPTSSTSAPFEASQGTRPQLARQGQTEKSKPPVGESASSSLLSQPSSRRPNVSSEAPRGHSKSPRPSGAERIKAMKEQSMSKRLLKSAGTGLVSLFVC